MYIRHKSICGNKLRFIAPLKKLKKIMLIAIFVELIKLSNLFYFCRKT